MLYATSFEGSADFAMMTPHQLQICFIRTMKGPEPPLRTSSGFGHVSAVNPGLGIADRTAWRPPDEQRMTAPGHTAATEFVSGCGVC